MESECPDPWPCARMLPDGFELLDTGCLNGAIIYWGAYTVAGRRYENVAFFFSSSPVDFCIGGLWVVWPKGFKHFIDSQMWPCKFLKSVLAQEPVFQCCPECKEEESAT